MLLRFAPLAAVLLAGSLPFASLAQTLRVDAAAPSTPFPHFWEQMFGSGRASLSLRGDYREDLRSVKQATAMKYVRFHGIFLDELGAYSAEKGGTPRYNFTYTDAVYDGLLANGVRPFVELSFMPAQLAARNDVHSFWYKPIVSPPKSYPQWDAFITAFVQHLVERYGIDEVAQWYFEVWNEPNLRFWTGDPAEASYFELYDHTARAVKSVSPRLRVGGPSTAYAAWIGDFIAHTSQTGSPVDFISSHIYEMDRASNIFGRPGELPRGEVAVLGVQKMHADIAGSSKPTLPLIVSEFSATAVNKRERDTLYMGPWLANIVRECDGLTSMMSFWTFSDIFEEHGVPTGPFPPEGSRGLIATDGIPKPSFVAFALLHRLGEQRLADPHENAIVTKRADGTVVMALWNKAESGAPQPVTVSLSHVTASAQATVYRLDREHGDTFEAFAAMGSPRYPTAAQLHDLRHVADAALEPAETIPVSNGMLRLSIPSQGLLLIEVK